MQFDQFVFVSNVVWAMDFIPAAGKWVRVRVILTDDLEIQVHLVFARDFTYICISATTHARVIEMGKGMCKITNSSWHRSII